MYLLKHKNEKAIEGVKLYDLIHHAVATCAPKKIYCLRKIFLRRTNSTIFSTETMSRSVTV